MTKNDVTVKELVRYSMKNRMALKSELNYVPDDAYFKSKVINWKNQSKKRSFVDEQVK